jgi:hypothetical protein
LLDVDRRDQRAVLEEVGRRGQRPGVRVHLDPAQVRRARVVGVDRGNGELQDDVVFNPLDRNLAHRPRQEHEGREWRPFLSAGGQDEDRQESQESGESWESDESKASNHNM